jgi:hypothetical protein
VTEITTEIDEFHIRETQGQFYRGAGATLEGAISYSGDFLTGIWAHPYEVGPRVDV